MYHTGCNNENKHLSCFQTTHFLFTGLCSSFAGSGVDICSFSVLTLLFRISEKVATPTSVVLMAVNTAIGFYWRQLMMSETDANGQLISSGISQEAWEYFACSGEKMRKYLERIALFSSGGCDLCTARIFACIALSSISTCKLCVHSRDTGAYRIFDHKTWLVVGM